MPDSQSLKDRLRLLRKQQKITQDALADLVNAGRRVCVLRLRAVGRVGCAGRRGCEVDADDVGRVRRARKRHRPAVADRHGGGGRVPAARRRTPRVEREVRADARGVNVPSQHIPNAHAGGAVEPGGCISVQSRKFTRDGRQWTTVCVDDDGHGIPAGVLPDIFDAFVSTRLDAQGTGLGLTVAEGIVQQHGGTISASNRPGGGARLEVTLRSPLRSDA